MTENYRPRPQYEASRRSQLKARLMTSGPNTLEDSELVELLLGAAMPTADPRIYARRLHDTFGGLDGIFQATSRELLKIPGIRWEHVAELKLIEAAARRLAIRRADERAVLASATSVIDYCRNSWPAASSGHLRVLYLNTKYSLIADEEAPARVAAVSDLLLRGIAARALQLNAGSLILAEYRSGDDVSADDEAIEAGLQLRNALRPLNLVLHDFFIITEREYLSFYTHGYL